MIIAKDALAGAISIAQSDKLIPALSHIAIEPDGTIIAMNRNIVFACEPVKETFAKKVPIENKEHIPHERIYFTIETAQTILKSIPRDNLFKKLLEHAVIITKQDSLATEVYTTDGRERHNIRVHRAQVRMFPDWKMAFAGKMGEQKVNKHVIWNRKRLQGAVAAIENACKYDGEFAPIFLFMGDQRVLWRSVNELTGQRMLIVFSDSEIEGGWMELNDWESNLLSQRKRIDLKIKRR
jgi:hypothetical protein